MFDFEDEATDKDLLKDRTFQLDNNVIHVKRSDPYGFWSVHFEKGQMPMHLRGEYTSFSLAERDVLYYLQEKGRKVEAVRT